METLVRRLKNTKPGHDIQVRHMRWMDGVEDLSSKRVVRHRDGSTSLKTEIVCEVVKESSLRRKCFKQYKVGDILVKRKKVANIYEDYKVSVSGTFEIRELDSVDRMLRDDYLLFDDDLTPEDIKHVKCIVHTRGVPVQRNLFPPHVLDLFCVVRHEGVLYHCYRTLVSKYGLTAIPRENLTEDVYSQEELFCNRRKNVMSSYINNVKICRFKPRTTRSHRKSVSSGCPRHRGLRERKL